MTRADLRTKFRAENPEITSNVASDVTINSWMLTANDEICCETRCIVTNESETFNSVINTQFYDLEVNISKFYDIDDMPGGGVYYDDTPLTKGSAAEMNYTSKNWKTRSSGTPKKYWRKGKYLWFDRAPDAVVEIAVDCVLRPNDFDNDAEEPFNELGHLQSYSDGINKYLQWRTKQKVGKQDEAMIAYRDYLSYVKWMKSRVKASKYGAVFIRPNVQGSR